MFPESFFILVATLVSIAIVKLTTTTPAWEPQRASILTHWEERARNATRAAAERAEARAAKAAAAAAAAKRPAPKIQQGPRNMLKTAKSKSKIEVQLTKAQRIQASYEKYADQVANQRLAAGVPYAQRYPISFKYWAGMNNALQKRHLRSNPAGSSPFEVTPPSNTPDRRSKSTRAEMEYTATPPRHYLVDEFEHREREFRRRPLPPPDHQRLRNGVSPTMQSAQAPPRPYLIVKNNQIVSTARTLPKPIKLGPVGSAYLYRKSSGQPYVKKSMGRSHPRPEDPKKYQSFEDFCKEFSLEQFMEDGYQRMVAESAKERQMLQQREEEILQLLLSTINVPETHNAQPGPDPSLPTSILKRDPWPYRADTPEPKKTVTWASNVENVRVFDFNAAATEYIHN
ncbi:hypothetical protein A4X13_0g7700 [Tilletia indica]|uniref:Uncharacterized protein n=1 Tax=Tilletia indica TaxID=43049 RepID=A0A8T8SHN5_9BASI|nr:hypothetical protein A4X13_0g7700 [Tilletia indica]